MQRIHPLGTVRLWDCVAVRHVLELMSSSICLFYYSFLFHIRFHVGQDGHGAHKHVQRAAAHAQLHHGQQPAYASESGTAVPALGGLLPAGAGGNEGVPPPRCFMRVMSPKHAAGKPAPKTDALFWRRHKGEGAESNGARMSPSAGSRKRKVLRIARRQIWCEKKNKKPYGAKNPAPRLTHGAQWCGVGTAACVCCRRDAVLPLRCCSGGALGTPERGEDVISISGYAS